MTAGIRDRILARNNPPYIQRPRHSAVPIPVPAIEEITRGPRTLVPRPNAPQLVRARGLNYGERNGHARLTEEIVREARRRRALGESGRALAREYGVAAMTMSDALRGVNWSHVK